MLKQAVFFVMMGMVAVAFAADATTTVKPLAGHNADSVAAILTDKEKLNGYISCVLNKGPCDASSTRLKAITQNAMGENCSKCDDKQKVLLAKMAAFVATNLPAEWEQMKDLFDPSKTQRKNIDDMVAKGKALAASTPVPGTTVKS